MLVSYYCQHVLGIGHLKRSLEICRHLAVSHETTLILGGPPVNIPNSLLNILQLPGLQMDSNFQNLVPCDQSMSLDSVKKARQERLYNHFKENHPHCFITELYPFGRKAFRFELDPILADIQKQILPPCTCVCSVRDILVEKKEGLEKWENRVIKTLNNYFHAVLVHADKSVVSLDETFGPIEKIIPPMYYTGFVSENIEAGHCKDLREQHGIDADATLIVASAGGGNVGSELLLAVTKAFSLLLKTNPDAYLQLFTGPYCEDEVTSQLSALAGDRVRIESYTDNFTDWLRAADLSISMAGYNTCMNLLQTGIPALVYPFIQNREQTLRAQKLANREPINILEAEELAPQILCQKIKQQLRLPRGNTTIELDGGARSQKIINSLLQ